MAGTPPVWPMLRRPLPPVRDQSAQHVRAADLSDQPPITHDGEPAEMARQKPFGGLHTFHIRIQRLNPGGHVGGHATTPFLMVVSVERGLQTELVPESWTGG